MQRAEENEWLSVGEECAREVDGLFHLAFGRERAQRHELNKSLHAHLASYVDVVALGICAQVFCKVGFCKHILVAVADVNDEVGARLVW